MADNVGTVVDTIEDAAIDGLGLRDAVDGALREARNSGLPGLVHRSRQKIHPPLAAHAATPPVAHDDGAPMR
jgi:hypothetical protein